MLESVSDVSNTAGVYGAFLKHWDKRALKHRFQPQIIKKYTRVVDLMMAEPNVMGLTKYGGLHYEHLHGDKEGLSSVKVNDQYRIEFREILEGDNTIAEMVSLTELSNHYK